jgi:ribonuclease Z
VRRKTPVRASLVFSLALSCIVPAFGSESGALRVTFLGTGAPRPSFQRYGPSLLIEAGDERLLVDPSWGLRERLLQAGSFELITGIDHVLLTHLHYDHTIGLPDLWLTGWLYGRRVPLRVEGPVGTAAFLEHLRRAFQWDVDYRVLVGVPAEGAVIEAKDVPPGWTYERNGLQVTAFEVEHMPIDLKTRERLDFEGQTLGYRIDYNGHSLVLSGDTRPSDALAELARGVDVLVHEVQVPSPGATKEANLANVSLSVHSEPEAVAGIFDRARPKLAVYSHIIPPEVSSEELLAATPYDGRMVVARDLMMIGIGEEIEVSDRPRLGEESFEKSRVLK